MSCPLSPERGPRSPYSSQLFIREQIPLRHKLYMEGKSWASNPPPPNPQLSDQFCLLQPEGPPSHCKAAHHPKTNVAKAVFPSTGQAIPHPLCRTLFPTPLMHSVFVPNRWAPVHRHRCLLKLSWTLNKSWVWDSEAVYFKVLVLVAI